MHVLVEGETPQYDNSKTTDIVTMMYITTLPTTMKGQIYTNFTQTTNTVLTNPQSHNEIEKGIYSHLQDKFTIINTAKTTYTEIFKQFSHYS